MRYVWTASAHGKAQLHAFKHPTYTTNGLLLGVKNGDTITFTDCVPLSHTFTLPAMLKVACGLVDEYCKILEPRPEIMGLYTAFAEDGTTLQANSVPDLIAQKIKSNAGVASVWVFKPDTQEFVGSTPPSSKGGDFAKIAPDNVVQSQHVRKAVKDVVKDMKFVELCDFDDHFHDPSCDWTNESLGKLFEDVDRSVMKDL
jgi:hypothetical protein